MTEHKYIECVISSDDLVLASAEWLADVNKRGSRSCDAIAANIDAMMFEHFSKTKKSNAPSDNTA